MVTRLPARLILAVAAPVSLLAACGAGSRDASDTTADTTTASATDAIVIDTTGTPHDLDCEGNDVEVGGAGNSVVLRGDCPTVTVRGSANSIEIERTDRLVVSGAANKVTWESGLTGAEPEIDNGGASNVVEQAEPLR